MFELYEVVVDTDADKGCDDVDSDSASSGTAVCDARQSSIDTTFPRPCVYCVRILVRIIVCVRVCVFSCKERYDEGKSHKKIDAFRAAFAQNENHPKCDIFWTRHQP
jgi:hypothetical protein